MSSQTVGQEGVVLVGAVVAVAATVADLGHEDALLAGLVLEAFISAFARDCL